MNRAFYWYLPICEFSILSKMTTKEIVQILIQLLPNNYKYLVSFLEYPNITNVRDLEYRRYKFNLSSHSGYNGHRYFHIVFYPPNDDGSRNICGFGNANFGLEFNFSDTKISTNKHSKGFENMGKFLNNSEIRRIKLNKLNKIKETID